MGFFRTHMSARQVQCRITRIRPLTSNVRQVMLSVESDIEIKHAKFKPGQWVDFFPPQYKNPGGFSISSSPDLLPDIELAIRASPHPVVQWVFDQAKVDDIVQDCLNPVNSTFSVQVKVILSISLWFDQI